jgi:hypothetical protein
VSSNTPNHIFRTYLRRLTNLSGNNRSVLLLRLTSEQLLDVQQLSFLNNEKAFEIVKALIAGKSKKICQVLDSRMEKTNESSRKLKRLQRIDKFIFDERGSNDLHVGWPFVRGKFADGTLVRCPLLYFPVQLEQQNAQWVLSLRKDAGITFNKSFLLAYAFYNKVKLDDELPDTSFDDFDSDSVAFRTQLYELIKDRIELNFNPDTFTDELIPFQEFKKDEFESTYGEGQLKLFPEAVLGIFPQAGSQLVPDYLHLIEHKPFENLDQFFATQVKGHEQNIHHWISSVKEENIYAPFSLDAYQEHALRQVKVGNSVVVQGPPGTGKSQLISNLIADAIASGKKVLLVCQKRVALDVVYDRLKEIKLGDFLGLVHDFRNDRKEIYEKIARQIESIDDYKARNRNIDVIQLERRFFQVSRRIDQLTETLEEFRTDLFDDKDCGLSAKELYLTSNPHEPAINLRQEFRHFNFRDVSDVVMKIKRYAQYASRLENGQYLWQNRKSFAAFQVGDLRNTENAIEDIPAVQQLVNQELNKILPLQLNLEECEALLNRQRDAEEMLGLISDEVLFGYFKAMLEEKDEETSLLWLQNKERECLNCFEGAGVEASLTMQQIMQCRDALQDRMKARRNVFRRIRWELFSEHKFFLKRVLIANQLAYTKQGLLTLEYKIDNRLNLEHHFTKLKTKSWLTDLPNTYQRYTLSNWFANQIKALRAKLIFNDLREVHKSIPVHRFRLAEFQEVMRSIFTIISTIPFHRNDWQLYLSSYQIRQLIQEPDRVPEFIASLRKDFDLLCEYDRLKDTLASYEIEVLQKLFDYSQQWDGTLFEQLFQNSLRLAWLEHIETRFPVLRSVSTFSMTEMETELCQLIEEKQQLATEIVLLRARERVYEHISYNRLNNRITYRDLHHQVTKKKKIWPVRKLMAEFHHEVFDLMPCWMASPESVSAIFPMQHFFDLVIFDEASQCFAERGLPTIFRGGQVLVAGDSKQLKPFELYQARWEDDAEGMEVEVDSLLELTARYLPTVHLQGHYRSKSLPLIQFSNRYFYNNKLRLLPDFEVMRQTEPVIEFIKIKGVWENQTNLLEAQKVVEETMVWIKQFSDKEIGIITFNAPQQMLILDLLEERFGQEGITLPESLFVKNIENVQGDEKDIIIFSIGYAPDEKGKMNMQFGSLNVAGGENRLNVAVTRAREKVVVVSSILPEELKVDDIKNEGPKLLRKYLEYAREVSSGNVMYKPVIQNHHSLQWYLASKITAQFVHNAEVKIQSSPLPFTDLGINYSNNLVGVVLTDDELFYSSLTVKEAYAYTPLLLTQKHWKYHRTYSRNWWLNSENARFELDKFVYQVTEEVS